MDSGHLIEIACVPWVGPDVVDVLPTTRVVDLAELSAGGAC